MNTNLLIFTRITHFTHPPGKLMSKKIFKIVNRLFIVVIYKIGYYSDYSDYSESLELSRNMSADEDDDALFVIMLGSLKNWRTSEWYCFSFLEQGFRILLISGSEEISKLWNTSSKFYILENFLENPSLNFLIYLLRHSCASSPSCSIGKIACSTISPQ